MLWLNNKSSCTTFLEHVLLGEKTSVTVTHEYIELTGKLFIWWLLSAIVNLFSVQNVCSLSFTFNLVSMGTPKHLIKVCNLTYWLMYRALDVCLDQILFRSFSVFPIGWSCRVYSSYTRVFLLYTRLPCGASTNWLVWLAVASRDGKQHAVETGAASINKTTYLVAKKDK